MGYNIIFCNIKVLINEDDIIKCYIKEVIFKIFKFLNKEEFINVIIFF